MVGPATGKARPPTVDSFTGGTSRRLVRAERRKRRPGRSATQAPPALCRLPHPHTLVHITSHSRVNSGTYQTWNWVIGSPGNGSFGSSFTSGLAGHHVDPVRRDPRFSGFRKNAPKMPEKMPKMQNVQLSWWRGTVVERRCLAGELSLSCARPAADG